MKLLSDRVPRTCEYSVSVYTMLFNVLITLTSLTGFPPSLTAQERPSGSTAALLLVDEWSRKSCLKDAARR